MTVTEGSPDAEVEEQIRAIKRLHMKLHSNPVLGVFTKVIVTVVGVAVILVGIVLAGPGVPGPGLLVIVFGLAILATEWAWADRLLQRAKRALSEARRRAREMDPAVRRRRILLGAAVTLLVCAAVVGYLWHFGWPDLAISGWDRLQSISDVVPDLPGM